MSNKKIVKGLRLHSKNMESSSNCTCGINHRITMPKASNPATTQSLVLVHTPFWYTIPKTELKKLDPRAKKAVMIGYSIQSKGYTIPDIESKKVVSPEARFNHNSPTSKFTLSAIPTCTCLVSYLKKCEISSET